MDQYQYHESNPEYVVLVDEQDNVLGRMEKMAAHEQGVLHRAFSAFVLNSDGQLLLQKRAMSKYHSPGLWTNSCCSHPREGEEVEEAAARRLVEEMGMTCTFNSQFSFMYRETLAGGLIEYEMDHVVFGYSNESPDPNPLEVDTWRWVKPEDILREIQEDAARFTIWFKLCFDRVLDHIPSTIPSSSLTP